MAFNILKAHSAQQVHVFLNLMVVFFTFSAELEVNYHGTAVRHYHDTVRAAGLHDTVVTEQYGCFVEKAVFAVKPVSDPGLFNVVTDVGLQSVRPGPAVNDPLPKRLSTCVSTSDSVLIVENRLWSRLPRLM